MKGNTSQEEDRVLLLDPDLKKRKRQKRREKISTKNESIAIINIAAGLDGCDDQLLPSSFRALEVDLHFHPSMLGQIALVQTLCLSLASPVWGFLSDHYSRKWILAAGSFVWGVVTILLAMVSNFWHVMALRALNGISLGSVGPISQSILADAAQKSSRGLAFGLVQLSTCIGRLIGGVVTTSFAFVQVGNMLAWRVCFFCVGGLSILLSLTIALFVYEIPRNIHAKKSEATFGGTGGAIQEEKKSVGKFLHEVFFQSIMIPSVLVILVEGLLGTIPWSAFSFNTMYFQYCGMTDVQAGLITGGLLVGAAIGGVIGGLLGDRLFLWSEAHGRPIIGQFAIFGRVPLVILAYNVLPKSPEYFVPYFFLAFFIGLSSIAGIAVNRPVLADVVRPDHRGTVFSIIVAAEGSFSALLGAPFVGFLAEKVFGYSRTTLTINQMSTNLRLGNANALAAALLYQTSIPWALSFILYCLLHFTYGEDQKKLNKVIAQEFDTDDVDDDGLGTQEEIVADFQDR